VRPVSAGGIAARPFDKLRADSGKERKDGAPAFVLIGAEKTKGGPAVIFQDVVHSIGTGEADCDEQSSFRGQTEWTSTRMPDSRFAVERRWSKPSLAA
jgi:hypothetical protein